MIPPSDLDERLSAVLAHSAPALRPRPVDAVVRRGRQRRRRRRAATVGAAAALALAGLGSGLLMRPAAPPEPSHQPASAAPAPRAPRLTEFFSGRTAVTLTIDAASVAGERSGGGPAAQVVMGYDDDDRILVERSPGRDIGLRNQWLVRPQGGAFVLRLAVEQPGGWVCMSHEAGGALRIRLCRAGAAAQQFTVTTTDDRSYAMAWKGTPVRMSRDGALVAGRDGTTARFTMARA